MLSNFKMSKINALGRYEISELNGGDSFSNHDHSILHSILHLMAMVQKAVIGLDRTEPRPKSRQNISKINLNSADEWPIIIN